MILPPLAQHCCAQPAPKWTDSVTQGPLTSPCRSGSDAWSIPDKDRKARQIEFPMGTEDPPHDPVTVVSQVRFSAGVLAVVAGEGYGRRVSVHLPNNARLAATSASPCPLFRTVDPAPVRGHGAVIASQGSA